MAKKETMGNMGAMKDSSMSSASSMSGAKDSKASISSSETCCYCNSNPCKCRGPACRIIGGIIVVVLGLLMIWPLGWFTFERSLGIVVLFFGIKILSHCRPGRCH